MSAQTERFYDELADAYHLIFEDWQTSIDRQAEALNAMIREQWGDAVRRVADVACGIGTQALGLAALGFDVTAADSSDKAVARARREAAQRQLTLHFHTADMRQCQEHLGGGFDLVIACDNAVPHLLNDDDILLALRQMHACLRCGGGVLLSVRDYAVETKGDSTIRPYGVRDSDGRRTIAFQVWDFAGDQYELSLFLIDDTGRPETPTTRVFRTRYYAITTDHLCALMQEAGFTRVQRLDEGFYQPVLVGTRA